MTEIKYIVGDMFPLIAESESRIIVPHVCNDIGAWGAGFVVPLGKFYPKSKEEYMSWTMDRVLGRCQRVFIDSRLVIINMIGQHKCGYDKNGRPPIRYAALAECLRFVGDMAVAWGSEIHAPAFGSDLAGGDWNFIEELIKECWCDLDLPVTIYSLKPIKLKSQIGPAICSDEDADYVGDPIKEGGAELLTDIPIDDLLV